MSLLLIAVVTFILTMDMLWKILLKLTYDEYLDDNVDMLREMVKKVME